MGRRNARAMGGLVRDDYGKLRPAPLSNEHNNGKGATPAVPAFNMQNPNRVFAGPASGSLTADPAFRALVAADMPASSGDVEAAAGSLTFRSTMGRYNYLINGGFDFSQRTTPGTDTTVASNAYGPDRWKVYGENASVQYSRQTGIGVTGLNCRYFGRFTKITNSGKLAFAQIIEHVDTVALRGRTVTVQLKLASNTSRTIRVALLESAAAATADAPATPLFSALNTADATDITKGTNVNSITPTSTSGGTIANGAISCAVTTTWTTFSLTATVPVDSKNLIVAVWADADFATSATLSVAEFGLYEGSIVATAIPWLPRLVQQEVALCQRRYCKSYDIDILPGTATVQGYALAIGYSTSGAAHTHPWPVLMATTPTVTLYSYAGTTNKITVLSSAADVGGTVTANAISTRRCGICSDSGTAFVDNEQYITHWTADAEIP